MSWAPEDMIADWSEDGTDVTFPIASLTNLTAADADGTTGDARQVALSLCQTIFEWFNEDTTNPEAMGVKLTGQSLVSGGDFAGKQRQVFQFTFYSDYPEDTVATEPA